MIDGMPASSSIAVPTGPRSQRGATSVRKKAMPKLTGTRDQHGDHRGDHGAVDRHQCAELVLDRIPLGADRRSSGPASGRASRPPHSIDRAAAASETSTKHARWRSAAQRKSGRCACRARRASDEGSGGDGGSVHASRGQSVRGWCECSKARHVRACGLLCDDERLSGLQFAGPVGFDLLAPAPAAAARSAVTCACAWPLLECPLEEVQRVRRCAWHPSAACASG